MHYVEFVVESYGDNNIYNITSKINQEIVNSKIKNGLINIFVQHTTCSIISLEYESGCISDIKKSIDMIIPQGIEYKHNELNQNINGCAHVRSTFIGQSLTLPLIENYIKLGNNQSVAMVDFFPSKELKKRIISISIMSSN
jgi:secondary thiamine-phosphate synthase enzyme